MALMRGKSTVRLSTKRREKLDQKVDEFIQALDSLGLPAPPVQVRIALRRWHWSSGSTASIGLVRASVVVTFLVLYAQLFY